MEQDNEPPRKCRKIDINSSVHVKPEEGTNSFVSRNVSMKYHSQNQLIQSQLTNSALSILLLSNDFRNRDELLLEVGCGSGLSTVEIQETYSSSCIVAFDISQSMINIARDYLKEKESILSCLLTADCSLKLPFRSNLFTNSISISVIQWLVNEKDIRCFLLEVYRCLMDEGKCVFQFYPTNVEHADLFVTIARDIGFDAILVLDVPHRTPRGGHLTFLDGEMRTK